MRTAVLVALATTAMFTASCRDKEVRSEKLAIAAAKANAEDGGETKTDAAVKSAAVHKPKAKPATIEPKDIDFPAPFRGEPKAKTTLAGNLLIEDFVLGEGPEAQKGSEVQVHYTGYLVDGTVFDTSLKRNRAFGFELGGRRVIKAWDQGVVGMKKGGQRRITTPPELAYGQRRAGKIPPGATLIFTIELLDMSAPLPEPKGEDAFKAKPVHSKTDKTGVKMEDILEGEGEAAKAGDEVVVHYTGRLDDGTVFDSSHKKKRPFKFPLGMRRVIKGWDVGIAGMKAGGLRRITVPAEMGYGERARGKIPSNSRLTFDVEMMRIKGHK